MAVKKNSVWKQKGDNHSKLGWKYVANQVPLSNRNQILPRIRNYCPWVIKIPNRKIIRDHTQTKRIGNKTSNAILERIQSVVVSLVHTYNILKPM